MDIWTAHNGILLKLQQLPTKQDCDPVLQHCVNFKWLPSCPHYSHTILKKDKESFLSKKGYMSTSITEVRILRHNDSFSSMATIIPCTVFYLQVFALQTICSATWPSELQDLVFQVNWNVPFTPYQRHTFKLSYAEMIKRTAPKWHTDNLHWHLIMVVMSLLHKTTRDHQLR